MSKSINIYIFIVVLFIFMSSCKSGGLFTAHRLKPEKPEEIYQKTVANYLDYETFSSKISTKLDLPEQKNSFSSSLRIKKDSIIWISVTPLLGIEMMRIVLTQDSVKFLNRINSTYFVGDYKYLQSSLNVNLSYEIIQSMVLDEFFMYENNVNNVVDFKDYDSDIDSNMYCLQNINGRELKKIEKGKAGINYLFQKFLIEPTNYKIARAEIDEKIYNRKLSLDYSEFVAVGNKYFPENLVINIENGTENANISIKYTKIAVNKELSFPFSISEKYQKIN
ncbi:MAG TPA: hypothetical protein DDX39_04660 [Bacteroidales bacterium]|nr:MAG: hypothetical protein A2W98_01820 [Bacteroidetes bacterium GWF2_33_38]OFY73756.1 MAG: hypothetical protein A2265_10350 [Bacteroidetes bacterium RIFOXYA12_FULL_33_9]OFY89880.1 MAG: hypothetical protein A2236_07220 [Bacteroidetes bacterium RIFOXYA2_FULL_33_7]HBF87916.1 hypothetical protein [Bacteroidales bacterium]